MDSINLHNSYMNRKSTDEDIISKLPDVMLLHILSFLPMKDATKTSILSKRWEYTWISIPSLTFYLEKGVEDVTQFVHFVDRVTSLRESRIQQFLLKVNQYVDESCIARWISAAVRHNVEELNIRFWYGHSFAFPRCLFASHSLTKLYLSFFGTFEFPPSICLSSLKRLKLKHVTFKDDESANNLLSGVPVLETMRLLRCNWARCSSVCVRAPNLRELEIEELGLEDLNLLELDEEYENLEAVNFMIFGSSLKYFHYRGGFFDDYCLYDVPCLDEGMVEYFFELDAEVPNIVSSRSYKLLKGFSTVKRLVLSTSLLKVLSYGLDMPVFSNLSTLAFCDIWEVELEFVALTKIFQNSPCLEALQFEGGIFCLHCTEEAVADSVPSSFLSSLKKLEIRYSSCRYRHPKFFVDGLEIFLNQAALLEKLNIYLLDKYVHDSSQRHPIDKEKLVKDLRTKSHEHQNFVKLISFAPK